MLIVCWANAWKWYDDYPHFKDYDDVLEYCLQKNENNPKDQDLCTVSFHVFIPSNYENNKRNSIFSDILDLGQMV